MHDIKGRKSIHNKDTGHIAIGSSFCDSIMGKLANKENNHAKSVESLNNVDSYLRNSKVIVFRYDLRRSQSVTKTDISKECVNQAIKERGEETKQRELLDCTDMSADSSEESDDENEEQQKPRERSLSYTCESHKPEVSDKKVLTNCENTAKLEQLKKPQIQSLTKYADRLIWALIFLGAVILLRYKSCVEKTCSFDTLEQKYPQQDKILWRTLSVGVRNILNGTTTTSGVFLLIHPEGADVIKLVKDIAENTASCFGNNLKAENMNLKDFNSKKAINDYGHTIEEYKSRLDKSPVVVIPRLNEIPGEAAAALHTICDTYSPIKLRSVHFLTFATNKTTREGVYKELVSLWEDKLKENELEPIIVRVMDQVLSLRNET